jgi:hypothetical protein
MVYEPDGKGFTYHSVRPNEPDRETEFIIDEKWNDFEGNTWYKVRLRMEIYKKTFQRTRINASGDTLEFEYTNY